VYHVWCKSRACGPVTYRFAKPHNASCRTEDSRQLKYERVSPAEPPGHCHSCPVIEHNRRTEPNGRTPSQWPKILVINSVANAIFNKKSGWIFLSVGPKNRLQELWIGRCLSPYRRNASLRLRLYLWASEFLSNGGSFYPLIGVPLGLRFHFWLMTGSYRLNPALW